MKDLRRIPPDCQMLKELAALLPEATHGCIQYSQITTSAAAERVCALCISPASPSELLVMINSTASLSTAELGCAIQRHLCQNEAAGAILYQLQNLDIY
jgi:hypothetical protein